MRNYLLSASRIMCQMTSMRREDGAVCRCREPSILLYRESRPHWLFRWLKRISASWRLLRMRLITYWSKRRMWNRPCRFSSRPVIQLSARAVSKATSTCSTYACFISLPCSWKFHVESGSLSWRTFRPDPPTVTVDHFPDKVEGDPKPTDRTVHSAGAVIAIEDMVKVGCGNAYVLVFDTYVNLFQVMRIEACHCFACSRT